jgi:hypothetical protein
MLDPATGTATTDGFGLAVASGLVSGLVTAAVLTATAAVWRWRRRPRLVAELATPSSSRGLPPCSFLVTLHNVGRTALRDFWVQIDVPAILTPGSNAVARMSEERSGGVLWGVFHAQSDRALGVDGTAEIAWFTAASPQSGRWDLPVIVRSVDSGEVLRTTVLLDLGPEDATADQAGHNDDNAPPAAQG